MRSDKANVNDPAAFADASRNRGDLPQLQTHRVAPASECKPFRSHNAKRCSVCDQALSIHEQVAGETCSRPHCKTQFLRVRLQSQRDLQTELRNQAIALRDSVAKSRNIDNPARLAFGILPFNERRLTNLPEKRVRKFRDRLMGIISQAATIRFGGVRETPVAATQPTDAPLDKKSLSVLSSGCATCGGECCRQGGDHAFIRVDTIVGFMQRHPQLRPRHVLQAYLSRLGHKTYDDSCVYQGRSGCVLPREMRSSVCNEYLCQGLHQVLDQLPDSPDGRTFVVATVGQEIIQAALVDPDRREVFDRSGHDIEAVPRNATRPSRSVPNGENVFGPNC